jgi:hypothetical protein
MLKQFNSYTRKLNRIITKINFKNLLSNDLIANLSNIKMPTNTKFQSKSRPKPNNVNVVNNKNTINNFYEEILQNSARKVSRRIDEFDNNLNTLTILNVSLDYGTEGASADNFQILVYGLHIPGDYTIKEVENDVVITLNDRYIDFDNVTIDDIYVIGKFK